MRRLGILAALLVAAVVPAGATADPVTALPAKVTSLTADVAAASYPSLDLRSGASAMTSWRVVGKTGNCCEHYLAVTAAGRLIDFGGTTLNFSDDDGETWSAVSPAGEPLLGGEGSVAVAPDGTILGVGWDTYSGDQLFALRYDPHTATWMSNRLPAHAPFYDREWLVVAPGPWTLGGQDHPWIAMFRGGTAEKDPWFVSADGLDYSNVAVQNATTSVSTTWPPVSAGTSNDSSQPLARAGATPLGHGSVMAQPQLGSSYGLATGGSTTWTKLVQPDGATPAGDIVADDRGWLHAVVADSGHLTFRTSTDQGRTWSATALPFAGEAEAWDLKVDSHLGLAAVAVHAHDALSGKDVDVLFKLDVSAATPALYKRYAIGNGDLSAGDNAADTSGARFDFGSVVILPDGRVAASFFDSISVNDGPRVAIEHSADLPPRAPIAPPVDPAAVTAPHAQHPAPASGQPVPGGEALLAPAPRGGYKITLTARRRGRGRGAILSGRVRPAFNAIARIERRKGRRWVGETLRALTDRGTFRAVILTRGTFRATIGGIHSRSVRVR